MEARDRNQARRRWVARGVALAATGIVAAAVLIAAASNGRVREVVPGALIRSPQPSPAELAELARRFGLRTVVSLRGRIDTTGWLAAERAACDELGVTHHALGFDPDGWPAVAELDRLIALLDDGERPMLLHCKRGVDRSGWATAVALLLAEGASVDDALAELSPTRGHLCLRWRCPLHLFFERYREHLRAAGAAHTPAAFRTWCATVYCPDPYCAELAIVGDPPSRVSAGETIRLTARITNRGRQGWRLAARAGGVRLGARAIGPLAAPPADPIEVFRTPHGPAYDVARADFGDGSLPPGAERSLDLAFRAPETAGAYVVHVDLVHELVHWFSDLGRPGVLLDLEVTDEVVPGSAGPTTGRSPAVEPRVTR